MILEVILLSLTLKIYSLGVPLVTVTCVSVYIYYARTQTRRELFSGIGAEVTVDVFRPVKP